MSEQTEPNESNAPGASDDFINLDNLDAILEEADPEFAASLAELGSDSDIASAEIEIDFAEEREDLKEEKSQKKKRKSLAERFPRFRELIVPPIRRIRPYLHSRVVNIRNSAVLIFQKSLVWVKTELPERINYTKKKLIEKINWLKQQIVIFKKLPIKTKLVMLLMVGLVGATAYTIKVNLKGNWLPNLVEPLPETIVPEGREATRFSPTNDLRLFYQAFPQPSFPVLIKAFPVNLKPRNSREVPMAFFEFTVETDSEDTAVEILDREKEILDSIQRSLEALTLDEVKGTRGIDVVKQEVKKTVNRMLNQGYVISVYLNLKVMKE